jgi:hypothetical protein
MGTSAFGVPVQSHFYHHHNFSCKSLPTFCHSLRWTCRDAFCRIDARPLQTIQDLLESPNHVHTEANFPTIALSQCQICLPNLVVTLVLSTQSVWLYLQSSRSASSLGVSQWDRCSSYCIAHPTRGFQEALVQTQLRYFERLASQHASERSVKMKRCGCWGYHQSLFYIVDYFIFNTLYLSVLIRTILAWFLSEPSPRFSCPAAYIVIQASVHTVFLQLRHWNILRYI